MGRIIGIDLGTTNSVSAYWSKRRPKPIYNIRFQSPLTPSVVALDLGRRYVGQDAKDRRLGNSTNVIYSIKRFIGRDYDDENVQKALELVGFEVRKADNGEVEVKLGDKYYSPIEISAMILEQLKKDAEQELGEEVTHAVITVPAYFGQRQKNATREAGRLAGLNVLRIINEPTAAALAYGVDQGSGEPEYFLVYDFGGGTFDISILMVSDGNFEVIRIGGDNFLGGDNIDELIISDLLKIIQRESNEDLSSDGTVKNILKGLAEQAKIELSHDDHVRIVSAGLIRSHRGSPINVEYDLTRSELEEHIGELVERTLELVQQTLQEADLEVSDIDRVILVGGSTRIPLVRRRLKEMFGGKIEVDVDPMQCVALGAAIQTTLPIEWLCPNCNTVNDGTQEFCHACQKKHEESSDIALPHIVCEACGKENRQGRLTCWNCGATVGAVISAYDEKVDKPNGALANNTIRIGDITSKYICVKVDDLRADSDNRRLSIVIPKGTPYPTHEAYKVELYTNHLNQESAFLPIYEAEDKDVSSEKRDLIGTVVMDLPSGLPKETPIIVESRIDGDGIITVNVYLKKMKDVHVERKFSMDGAEFVAEIPASETMRQLGFLILYFSIVSSNPLLNKYLEPGQAEQADRLVEEAKPILEVKNEIKARLMVDKMTAYEFPLPTWEVFWAQWASEQEQISATERSQVNQIIKQMNDSLIHGDIDKANKHLHELRNANEKMIDKLPSNLLKSMRG